MKKTVSVFALVLILATHQIWANPFSAKIKKQSKPKPKPAIQKLLFKGYAVIGEQHFGLVQIGDKDFEVVKGDVIDGIRIRKVSSSRLDYSVNNQSKYILLNSK